MRTINRLEIEAITQARGNPGGKEITMNESTFCRPTCTCEAPTTAEEKQPLSLILHHNSEVAERIAALAARIRGEVNGDRTGPESGRTIKCMRDEISYQTDMLESAEIILTKLLVMLGGG